MSNGNLLNVDRGDNEASYTTEGIRGRVGYLKLHCSRNNFKSASDIIITIIITTTKPETVGPFYSRTPDVVSTYWHLHSPFEDKFHPRKLAFPPQGLRITWTVSTCFLSLIWLIAKSVSFLWQKWNLWAVTASLKCQRSFSIFFFLLFCLFLWFMYSWCSECLPPQCDEKGWNAKEGKWRVSFPLSLRQSSTRRSIM